MSVCREKKKPSDYFFFFLPPQRLEIREMGKPAKENEKGYPVRHEQSQAFEVPKAKGRKHL